MSVVMANHSTWDNLNHGRPGFIRFGGYLGLILGAAALAMFGQGGYNQNAYLFQLSQWTAIKLAVLRSGGVFIQIKMLFINRFFISSHQADFADKVKFF